MTKEELELARKGFSKNEIEEILSESPNMVEDSQNKEAVNANVTNTTQIQEKATTSKIEEIETGEKDLNDAIEVLDGKILNINTKIDDMIKSIQESNLQNSVVDTPTSDETADDILANILKDMPIIEV